MYKYTPDPTHPNKQKNTRETYTQLFYKHRFDLIELHCTRERHTNTKQTKSKEKHHTTRDAKRGGGRTEVEDEGAEIIGGSTLGFRAGSAGIINLYLLEIIAPICPTRKANLNATN